MPLHPPDPIRRGLKIAFLDVIQTCKDRCCHRKQGKENNGDANLEGPFHINRGRRRGPGANRPQLCDMQVACQLPITIRKSGNISSIPFINKPLRGAFAAVLKLRCRPICNISLINMKFHRWICSRGNDLHARFSAFTGECRRDHENRSVTEMAGRLGGASSESGTGPCGQDGWPRRSLQ